VLSNRRRIELGFREHGMSGVRRVSDDKKKGERREKMCEPERRPVGKFSINFLLSPIIKTRRNKPAERRVHESTGEGATWLSACPISAFIVGPRLVPPTPPQTPLTLSSPCTGSSPAVPRSIAPPCLTSSLSFPRPAARPLYPPPAFIRPQTQLATSAPAQRHSMLSQRVLRTFFGIPLHFRFRRLRKWLLSICGAAQREYISSNRVQSDLMGPLPRPLSKNRFATACVLLAFHYAACVGRHAQFWMLGSRSLFLQYADRSVATQFWPELGILVARRRVLHRQEPFGESVSNVQQEQNVLKK